MPDVSEIPHSGVSPLPKSVLREITAPIKPATLGAFPSQKPAFLQSGVFIFLDNQLVSPS